MNKVRKTINNKLFKWCFYSLLLGFIAFSAWYCYYPHKIQNYRITRNAQIIETQGFVSLESGKDIVVSISEGYEASKTSTAHARCDTILLVLEKPLVVGEWKKCKEFNLQSYFRRTTKWAPDPKFTHEFNYKIRAIKDRKVSVEIEGVMKATRWEFIENGCITSSPADPSSPQIKWMEMSRLIYLNDVYRCEIVEHE